VAVNILINCLRTSNPRFIFSPKTGKNFLKKVVCFYCEVLELIASSFTKWRNQAALRGICRDVPAVTGKKKNKIEGTETSRDGESLRTLLPLLRTTVFSGRTIGMVLKELGMEK